MVEQVNIRATSDKKFWGTEYENSVYLSESAQYHLTLREILDDCTPILEDRYESRDEQEVAFSYCQELHEKYIKILTIEFNRIHGLNASETFWRTVFGYWLYRYICVVFDKYSRLKEVAVDQSSIKLLSKKSFHIPSDHHDYFFCFGSDHGVMQLVTLYYEMYASRNFDREDSTWCGLISKNPSANVVLCEGSDRVGTFDRCLNLARRVKRQFKRKWRRGLGEEDVKKNAAGQKSKMFICCGCYTEELIYEVSKQSSGGIDTYILPEVNVYEKPVDETSRATLSQIPVQDEFEKYLVHTLPTCVPKILVEYFKDYYDVYKKDIERQNCCCVVTECWISFMPLSIYCAAAREEAGAKFVLQQHGASMHWLHGSLVWLDIKAADNYLSTGWSNSSTNILSGGFSVRNRDRYVFDSEKTDIIHITTTGLPHFQQFGGAGGGAGGGRVLKYLQNTAVMIEKFPKRLKNNYVLRLRKGKYFWDLEKMLEVKKLGLRLDEEESMSVSMHNAKLVVIDHISTGLGEILANRIPFILLHYPEYESLSEEYHGLFDELISCGIVQMSADMGVRKIDLVYDDVEKWWSGEDVRKAVQKLADMTLGTNDDTIKNLLELSESSFKSHIDQDVNKLEAIG